MDRPLGVSRYELVEHTADLAIRVRGRDLGELCANLAWAVGDLLADAGAVATAGPGAAAVPLALDAADREALLVTLANELIYRYEADGLLLPALEVLDVDGATGGRLRATARGEAADPARHALRAGLKAATWHQLSVTDRPDGSLEAFLVFDV